MNIFIYIVYGACYDNWNRKIGVVKANTTDEAKIKVENQYGTRSVNILDSDVVELSEILDEQ